MNCVCVYVTDDNKTGNVLKNEEIDEDDEAHAEDDDDDDDNCEEGAHEDQEEGELKEGEELSNTEHCEKHLPSHNSANKVKSPSVANPVIETNQSSDTDTTQHEYRKSPKYRKSRADYSPYPRNGYSRKPTRSRSPNALVEQRRTTIVTDSRYKERNRERSRNHHHMMDAARTRQRIESPISTIRQTRYRYPSPPPRVHPIEPRLRHERQRSKPHIYRAKPYYPQYPKRNDVHKHNHTSRTSSLSSLSSLSSSYNRSQPPHYYRSKHQESLSALPLSSAPYDYYYDYGNNQQYFPSPLDLYPSSSISNARSSSLSNQRHNASAYSNDEHRRSHHYNDYYYQPSQSSVPNSSTGRDRSIGRRHK